MKFGNVPLSQALGGIIAHAVRRDGLVLKKGERIGEAEMALMQAAGVREVTVAMLEPGDIGEDIAAARLATAISGAGIRVERAFTGRSNLYATHAGLFMVQTQTIDAINVQDERITLATLTPMRAVVEGEMIATIKIIPFAVPTHVLEACLAVASAQVLEVKPYHPQRIGVISTLLPGLKPSVVDKTLRVLEDRLAPMGSSIHAQAQVPHETYALQKAIQNMNSGVDMIIIFGASAITDRRDVIPSAVEASGGSIVHFGMPVDPGNLLLLADMSDGKKLIGAPGCARSPKENGFDFILQRLLAQLPVSAQDIRRMGAGGLLMEIVSRPQPRQGIRPAQRDE